MVENHYYKLIPHIYISYIIYYLYYSKHTYSAKMCKVDLEDKSYFTDICNKIQEYLAEML